MNRREFIRTSALASAAVVAAPVFAQEETAKRTFKVGLVGCGGRGTGAVHNMLDAAKELGVEVKIVGVCDFFREKALVAAKTFGCPETAVFAGPNGYKELFAGDCGIVILATPLSFRPRHFAAAVAAGKHVFAEKGVAVDAPGVRLFIETAREAARKHLTVVAGTQRRHACRFRQQAKALADGTLKPILGGSVYWNGAVPWIRGRKPGMTDADYLADNWLNFEELSGDHICEQHIHQLDVANWFIGRYPVSVNAFGMRARRRTGNQYDFFASDFDYGEGVHIQSQCRQIDGCANLTGEIFRTADAIISAGGRVTGPDGKTRIEIPGGFEEGNELVIEHKDLLRSVMGTGPYFNEGEQVAMSTACAIMARESAYTGQVVKLSYILTNTDSPVYAKRRHPTPEEFETGAVQMPVELAAMPDLPGLPLPGEPWRDLPKT